MRRVSTQSTGARPILAKPERFHVPEPGFRWSISIAHRAVVHARSSRLVGAGGDRPASAVCPELMLDLAAG
jgi:hypothetical protein